VAEELGRVALQLFELNLPIFDDLGDLFNAAFGFFRSEYPVNEISLKFANGLSEDDFKVADAALENPNSLVKPKKDPLLDGVLYDKVVNVNAICFLPIAVDPSDPLLNNHWVPG
jgi:hypothetical protein